MNNYAQIDVDGILLGIRWSSEEIVHDELIPISEEDYSTLAERFYRPRFLNGEWVEGATTEEVIAIRNPVRPEDRMDQMEEENALLSFELITTQMDLAQTKQEHADLVLYLVETEVI